MYVLPLSWTWCIFACALFLTCHGDSVHFRRASKTPSCSHSLIAHPFDEIDGSLNCWVIGKETASFGSYMQNYVMIQICEGYVGVLYLYTSYDSSITMLVFIAPIFSCTDILFAFAGHHSGLQCSWLSNKWWIGAIDAVWKSSNGLCRFLFMKHP